MVTMTFEDVVQRINKRFADIGPQIHLAAQYVRYILYNTNSVVLPMRALVAAAEELSETVIGLIIAEPDLGVVARIDEFHRRQPERGVYDKGGQSPGGLCADIEHLIGH